MEEITANNTFKFQLKSKWEHHVFLTNSGIGLKNMMPLRSTFFPSNSINYVLHFYVYAVFKLIFGKSINLTGTNFACIHNHWCRGYHHWLSEALIKIQHIPIPLEELTIVLPEDYPSFTFESLQTFPFKSIKKIPSKVNVRFKKVFIVENPISGKFNPADLDTLRKYFWEQFKLTPKPRLNLYISRRDAQTRKVKNETDLEELLRELGFQVIYPESLSFKQQVRIFSQCKCLVSIHGAGMTNCIFMPEGSNIYEFYRRVEVPEKEMNHCFVNLAKALNHFHFTQFCQTAETLNSSPGNLDLIVDLSRFRESICNLLNK